MKKGMIFDMDGTLWDSVDSIVVSWNAALQEIGETGVTVTRQQLMGLMGKTMDVFARTLFPHYTPEKGAEWIDTLGRIENEFLGKYGAVLLGDVKAVFIRLREMGYGVYIVSNCQSGYIEGFLKYYHLEDLVEDTECYGDTLRGKADNLKLLIERNHLDQYLYLGDTQGDLDACREAGVPFLFAAYGFGSVDASIPRIEALDDLPEYLAGKVRLGEKGRDEGRTPDTEQAQPFRFS